MEVIPFAKRIDRTHFSCGKADLDDWLRLYSRKSEERDTTRTFLAVDEDERLVGYYAMKTFALDVDDAARAFGVGRRRYPVPAMLLARLAVDSTQQGRGIGGALLVDALERLLVVSQSIGFEIVVVHAIDHDASAFYGRFGFTAFQDNDLDLFLTTEALRLTFESA